MVGDSLGSVHLSEKGDHGGLARIGRFIVVADIRQLTGGNERKGSVDSGPVPGRIVSLGEFRPVTQLDKNLRVGCTAVEQVEVLAEPLLNGAEFLYVFTRDV